MEIKLTWRIANNLDKDWPGLSWEVSNPGLCCVCILWLSGVMLHVCGYAMSEMIHEMHLCSLEFQGKYIRHGLVFFGWKGSGEARFWSTNEHGVWSANKS